MSKILDYDSLETKEEFEKLYQEMKSNIERFSPGELVLFNFVTYELCKWDEVNDSMSKLKLLDEAGKLTGEDRGKYLFIRATFERFSGHMKKALATAREAEEIGLESDSNRLKYQLGGFIALCLMETGKIFLAIDRLHEVLARPELKSYDQGMLLAYETMFLSHLGQNEAIVRSLDSIIESERDVFDLLLEMIDGKIDLTRKWIQEGWPPKLTKYMGVKFITLLLQSVIVLGDESDLEDVKKSWIMEYLARLCKSNSQVEYLEKFQAMLGVIPYEKLRENAQHESWKINIDNYFTDTLVLIKKGDQASALEVIEKKIRPVCRENHLMSSLYPIYQNGKWLPESGWSKAYEKYLGLKTNNKKEERVLVFYDRVQFERGPSLKIELDFKKSPNSLRLLQVLAGNEGTAFSKQEIHEQLYSGEYHPFLHDPKLLKNLKRLEKKMQDAGMPSPWYLPGDNTVVLAIKIEVR